MSDYPAARAAQSADAHRGLRIAALTAVALGVLLLAAAAFALSYAGIHAIALEAGVSASLARLYPLIFDAMLVVAGAAVLSLRGAGLVTRSYAWLTMLILLAAAAGADALHATGTRVPSRPAAAAGAIIPWAVVLISFGLLIAMLRHAQHRRAAGQEKEARSPSSALAPPIAAAPYGQARSHSLAITGSQATVLAASHAADLPTGPTQAGPLTQAGFPVQAGSPVEAEVPVQAGSPVEAEIPVQAGPAEPGYSGGGADRDRYGQPYRQDSGAELAVDADAGQDDPTSDEASAVGQSAAAQVPRARQQENSDDDEYRPDSLSAAPTPDPADDADPEPPVMPPLDRMWSSPTPPSS
jgi:uncharacterized membrane protein SirB2